MQLEDILNKEELSKEDLIFLLSTKDEEGLKKIAQRALEIKEENVGRTVYYRGLIEFSNICAKNCNYCGIRRDNKKTHRYTVSDEEILDAAKFAWENNYGSLVLQSGELSSKAFVDRVEYLLKEIKKLSNGELGITLSCGEQTLETYKRWFEAGAHRYLLRIETTNKDLYYKIHPNDELHNFEQRVQALKDLRTAGFQVGTGIMIGLPFQTAEDLANDLLFFRDMGIHMIGMGPYIEHEETPMYQYKDILQPKEDRFKLALKVIAVLRIFMKDINIAAATALQAIDPMGREKALKLGANIMMPNVTPRKYREDYLLYEDKPCIDEEADECKNCLEARIHLAGDKIGYGEWGDSKRFKKENK